MKSQMFGGIDAMALAFTLAIVGVDGFAQQTQAADTKVDQKLQECAKACSDCQSSQAEPPKQDQKVGHKHVQIQTPEPLRIEHEHLHRLLENAIQSGGKTGEAAKMVAKRMAPHFEKEEQFAMPPLSLLTSLSQGTATKEEMRQILPLTEKLKEELPEMLKEHQQIVLALKELSKAAKAEEKAKVAEFAEKLILHARTEEEVLYPAAILVGEHIKLKLKMEE